MRIASPLHVALVPLVLAACSPSTTTPSDGTAPAASGAVVAAPSSQPAGHAPEASAAAAPGATPQTRDDVDSDGVVRRGETLTAAAPLSVKDCAAQAATLNGKSVKVEGTVDQVCAKKGCWWVLGGGEGAPTIRITAKGYGFFVPRDAKGKKAVAEGVLEVKELSPDEAAHLAEDGNDPSMKDLKQELRLEAAAIEMRS